MKDQKTETKFVTIRMPLDLWRLVKAEATAENRSVTSQILYVLKNNTNK